MRYKYYHDGKGKTICVSSFAKKAVRGIAICADEDEYSEEVGEILSRLRCDKAIAEKRVRSSVKKLEKARKELENADKNYDYFNQYLTDSYVELAEVSNALKQYEESLGIE